MRTDHPPFHKDSMQMSWTKRHIAVTDHAILDSADRVIAIAKYPLDMKRSNIIIPFPDLGKKPKLGWFYNRDTLRFQETDPNEP